MHNEYSLAWSLVKIKSKRNYYYQCQCQFYLHEYHGSRSNEPNQTNKAQHTNFNRQSLLISAPHNQNVEFWIESIQRATELKMYFMKNLKRTNFVRVTTRLSAGIDDKTSMQSSSLWKLIMFFYFGVATCFICFSFHICFHSYFYLIRFLNRRIISNQKMSRGISFLIYFALIFVLLSRFRFRSFNFLLIGVFFSSVCLKVDIV